LVYLLNRSSQHASDNPDSSAMPSEPAPRPVQRFAGPAAFTFTLENAALSPDGRVTAWSYDGNDVVMCIGVWGGAEPDLSQQISLTGPTAPVRALAFSSHGETLAAASADGNVSLWDVASGQPSVVHKGHTDEVTAVAFSPDGVSMATGSRDKTIRLWDSFGGLPTLLVTSDGGRAVRLWNHQSGAEVGRLELPDSKVISAAFAPDGSSIAVAGVDGKIIVRSLTGGNVLADFDPPHTPLFVQFAANGSLLWSRFETEHLRQIGATSLLGRIATATRSAERAIAGFGIPEGVQVELFANESMVSNPAAICRDEQGRLYVAETFRFDTEVNLGYAGREIWLLDDLANQTIDDRLAMYEKYKDATSGGMHAHRKYSERIRRLEDSDGNGKADRSSIFATGFNTPLTGTGLIARDGEGCCPRFVGRLDHPAKTRRCTGRHPPAGQTQR
jgi:hypothetical protein